MTIKKPTAAVFPGQGSQYVGMATDLLHEFPYTKTLFEEASDAIQTDIIKLCQNGPDNTLQLTFNAQPSILTTSVAWYSVLRKENGFQPSASAGHSLGEYSALVAAEALHLFDAVKLVRLRGELMQNAVPAGKGKMAALIGLDDKLAQQLCAKASQGDDSIVVPANYNSPGQIVIAGHFDAVERAEKLASDKESHYKARKVIPLKVSAPFHCPLMKPVAEKFEGALKQTQWKTPAFPVVANVDAKVHTADKIIAKLTEQLFSPVLWTSCVNTLTELACQDFVEAGPGKVLSGLVKRCSNNALTVSIDSIDDFRRYHDATK